MEYYVFDYQILIQLINTLLLTQLLYKEIPF